MGDCWGCVWSSLPTGVLFFKIPFTFGVHSILCNLHGGFVFAIVLATNCPSVSLQLYGRLLALIIFIEKKRYCSVYYIGTIDSAHKGESAFIWKSVYWFPLSKISNSEQSWKQVGSTVAGVCGLWVSGCWQWFVVTRSCVVIGSKCRLLIRIAVKSLMVQLANTNLLTYKIE